MMESVLARRCRSPRPFFSWYFVEVCCVSTCVKGPSSVWISTSLAPQLCVTWSHHRSNLFWRLSTTRAAQFLLLTLMALFLLQRSPSNLPDSHMQTCVRARYVLIAKTLHSNPPVSRLLHLGKSNLGELLRQPRSCTNEEQDVWKWKHCKTTDHFRAERGEGTGAGEAAPSRPLCCRMYVRITNPTYGWIITSHLHLWSFNCRIAHYFILNYWEFKANMENVEDKK